MIGKLLMLYKQLKALALGGASGQRKSPTHFHFTLRLKRFKKPSLNKMSQNGSHALPSPAHMFITPFLEIFFMN